jgi:hypothetical protein
MVSVPTAKNKVKEEIVTIRLSDITVVTKKTYLRNHNLKHSFLKMSTQRISMDLFPSQRVTLDTIYNYQRNYQDIDITIDTSSYMLYV